MSKKSNKQLSREYLEKSGWQCENGEHWNAFAKVFNDLFGFGDLLAYKPGNKQREGAIALVQTTSDSNFAARKKKIYASPHFKGWKRSNGLVIVHGWGPNGLREEYL